MTVLLLLLTHLIADFWLQSDQMVKHKIQHLKKHILHHLLTTGIVLAVIWGYQYEFQHVISYFISPLAFIIITHLLIDLLKIKFVDSLPKSPTDNMKKLGYFLADQVLHVMMILDLYPFLSYDNCRDDSESFKLEWDKQFNSAQHSIIFCHHLYFGDKCQRAYCKIYHWFVTIRICQF